MTSHSSITNPFADIRTEHHARYWMRLKKRGKREMDELREHMKTLGFTWNWDSRRFEETQQIR